MKKGATLKDITKVASATMGSRVLGLVRDQIAFAILGVGVLNSAFLFAFTLPNLFRRLLGEGALTSAMIPVLTSVKTRGGQAAAFEFLNKVISRAFIIMAVITILAVAVSLIYSQYFADTERYLRGAQFTALLFPYMILICLAAVFAGALNVMGIFGIPSLGPILLNVAMIASLLIGYFTYGDDALGTVLMGCYGVLIGGVLQFAVPAYFLHRHGWRFKFCLAPSHELSELMRLFTPALMGAAVIQINIVVSKFLAFGIDNTSLSALYLSSRLVELPLGVFTIAIATVYFPKLSLLSERQDSGSFAAEYRRSLLTTLAITVPATAGLVVLSTDVLEFLFAWGQFNSADVALCAPILVASVIGMPIYSISTFATRGFHSRKDMRTPLKISVAALAANVIFCLLLIKPYGAVGLALANVFAAALQAVLLSTLLRKKMLRLNSLGEVVKILFASAVMAALILVLKHLSGGYLTGKTLAAINCALLIPAGGLAYFVILRVLKFEQITDLIKVFKK